MIGNPTVGFVFTGDDDAQVQAAAMQACDEHSRVPSAETRFNTVDYLLRLCHDQIDAQPHVHITYEICEDPAVTVIKVTRQLYPPGYPQNDQPVRRELFDPCEPQTSAPAAKRPFKATDPIAAGKNCGL